MAPAICSLSGRIRSLSPSLSPQRAEAPTWAGGGVREEEEGAGRQRGRCSEGSTAPPPRHCTGRHSAGGNEACGPRRRTGMALMEGGLNQMADATCHQAMPRRLCKASGAEGHGARKVRWVPQGGSPPPQLLPAPGWEGAGRLPKTRVLSLSRLVRRRRGASSPRCQRRRMLRTLPAPSLQHCALSGTSHGFQTQPQNQGTRQGAPLRGPSTQGAPKPPRGGDAGAELGGGEVCGAGAG